MINEQHLGQLEVYKFTIRAIGMFVSMFCLMLDFVFCYLNSGTLSNVIHVEAKSRKRVGIKKS